MDLEHALQQFDRVQANLRRLEALLDKLTDVMPGGISFADYSPQALQYRELCRGYRDLVRALPAIGGFQIRAEPVPLDEIARLRFDAGEIDEPEILIELAGDIPPLPLKNSRTTAISFSWNGARLSADGCGSLCPMWMLCSAPSRRRRRKTTTFPGGPLALLGNSCRPGSPRSSGFMTSPRVTAGAT